MTATVLLLGAFHGLNPAMGWLFAVALGLQEGRRGAVLRALPPIALGHAASVAVVAAVVVAASAVVPATALRVAGAVALLGFGGYRLAAGAAHPRWVGMRVSRRDLVLWSFLMSSAHGAGLMLLPALLARPAAPHAGHAAAGAGGAHAAHAAALAAAGSPAALVLALHSAAMLGAMAVAAVAVYELLGLDFLRRAWINVDGVWAGALVLAGLVTLATA